MRARIATAIGLATLFLGSAAPAPWIKIDSAVMTPAGPYLIVIHRNGETTGTPTMQPHMSVSGALINPQLTKDCKYSTQWHVPNQGMYRSVLYGQTLEWQPLNGAFSSNRTAGLMPGGASSQWNLYCKDAPDNGSETTLTIPVTIEVNANCRRPQNNDQFFINAYAPPQSVQFTFACAPKTAPGMTKLPGDAKLSPSH